MSQFCIWSQSLFRMARRALGRQRRGSATRPGLHPRCLWTGTVQTMIRAIVARRRWAEHGGATTRRPSAPRPRRRSWTTPKRSKQPLCAAEPGPTPELKTERRRASAIWRDTRHASAVGDSGALPKAACRATLGRPRRTQARVARERGWPILARLLLPVCLMVRLRHKNTIMTTHRVW